MNHAGYIPDPELEPKTRIPFNCKTPIGEVYRLRSAEDKKGKFKI